MRARRIPPILGAAALIGSLAAGLVPAGPVAAIDPLVGSPIPDEPIAFTVPGDVMHALTFDIDGDGVRELATLGVSSDDPDMAVIRVWWFDARGQATGSNEVSHPRFDGKTVGPAGIADGSSLFIAHRAGRPHLFATLEAVPDDGSDPCCLTILEVTLTSEQSIGVTRVADTRRLASQLVIADLDGDRTDELVVVEGPWNWEGDVAPPLETALLRWDGSRFVRRPLDLGPLPGCCTSIEAVGNTDEHPGDDLHLSVYDEDAEAQRVLRVTLRGDTPAIEVAPPGPAWGSRIVPLEDGPALLTMDEFSTARLWRWPRDQAMELLGSRPTSGCGVAAVLGSGRLARVLASTCQFPAGQIEVMPGTLAADPSERALFASDGRVAALPPSVQQSLFPWEGRIPDGLPGMPEAYLFSGQLVFPVADPEALAGSRSAALMIGTRPVGRVGPDGAWEVLALNDDAGHYDPNPAPEFVWVASQPAPGPLRVVPAEALMAPDPDGSSLNPTFHGAAREPAAAAPSRLLAGTQAVDVELDGPPGSVVRWLAPGVPDGQGEIGPTGVLTIPVLPAEDADRRNQSGTIWITVVTPLGNAYSGQWSIRVVQTPPDLEVTVPEGLLMLSPAISGRTSPGAAVTVNGIPATIGSSGAFRIRVEPGVVPTEFRIVASDAVGNANVEVVSLVWPVDYRKLPFVPIFFLVTVAAGIALYVRRPMTGERPLLEDDGATIEEIGD